MLSARIADTNHCQGYFHLSVNHKDGHTLIIKHSITTYIIIMYSYSALNYMAEWFPKINLASSPVFILKLLNVNEGSSTLLNGVPQYRN